MKMSLLRHHCLSGCHRRRISHHQETTTAITNLPPALRTRCATQYQFRCIVGLASTITEPTTHRHAHQSIIHRIHPKHLYQIINDVDKYQNFLPHCHESRVLQTSSCGTMYDAVLRVGLPGLPSLPSVQSSSLLEERYISRVRMISPALDGDVYTVEARSIQSQLFDSLKSRWQLTLVENGHHDNKQSSDERISKMNANDISCKVNFEVEIQVSNPLISFALDSVLKDVAKEQVLAFESRCNEVPFLTELQ